MIRKDYLSELLSVQCDRAYGTVRRLMDSDTVSLSDEDRALLATARDVLPRLRDRFRVTKTEDMEDGGKR